ncbi:hypothetical protein N7495_009562 [Penicillium taxi]|uniref:uncharacterized protein n=1 Tax=Penicillium taxi TaxID=168475 RepID=UPI002544FECB|nr:uncharacterized protein N7495_009562 [Penicillium taxi]KAJ5885052.1 hypothetical protein N7495_009562 [Penicillium taxi]
MRSQLLAVLASLSLASATSTLGCYSTVSGLTETETFQFQSISYCSNRCDGASYSYAVLQGTECSCTNDAPLSSAKVASSECDTACQGWPVDNCGGDDTYSVVSTSDIIVDSASDATTAASSSIPTSIAAATVIVAPATVNTSLMPTGIITAPSSVGVVSSTIVKSASAIATATGSSTPTPTTNAAGSLRVGSVAGVVVAGLGLML